MRGLDAATRCHQRAKQAGMVETARTCSELADTLAIARELSAPPPDAEGIHSGDAPEKPAVDGIIGVVR